MSVDDALRRQSIRLSYSIIPTTPLAVGNRRQLLMDNYAIDDCWNCRRTVHQPEKWKGNPLIAPTTPAEGRGTPFTSVVYDEEEKKFRLWGTAHPHPHQAFYCHGVYYESADGIAWERPVLDKVSCEGSTANNVFFSQPDRSYDDLAVIRTPDPWKGKGRFAMVYDSIRMRPGEGLEGYEWETEEQRLAFSDDGISWRDQAENPIIAGISDTHNNIVYNPDRKTLMHYRRPSINAYHNRRPAFSESADLVSWTQPQTVIFPDELDPPMLYGMTVDRYQGVFLGYLMMYYCSDICKPLWPPFPKEFQMENQLAWSRDGIGWHRHPERPVFIETGRRGTTCDWGLVRKGTGIIEKDGRLFLYYEGADRFKKRAYTDRFGNWHLCLATLRKDGFVSVDSRGEGCVLTKPLLLPGARLHVNAQTSDGGAIRVALRRGDGNDDGGPIEGYGFDDCREFHGDSVDHSVLWKDRTTVDGLKGRSVRIHFELRDACLYSFWFEP